MLESSVLAGNLPAGTVGTLQGLGAGEQAPFIPVLATSAALGTGPLARAATPASGMVEPVRVLGVAYTMPPSSSPVATCTCAGVRVRAAVGFGVSPADPRFEPIVFSHGRAHLRNRARPRAHCTSTENAVCRNASAVLHSGQRPTRPTAMLGVSMVIVGVNRTSYHPLRRSKASWRAGRKLRPRSTQTRQRPWRAARPRLRSPANRPFQSKHPMQLPAARGSLAT